MKLDLTIGHELAGDAETLALLHAHEMAVPLLGALKDIAFPDNLALMPSSPPLVQACCLMREALEALPDAPDTDCMDALAADFAAIYLLGSLGASPCESFWLDADHLLCQEPMFAMRALYTQDALAVPSWRVRPDDHLVPQLQFLAHRLVEVKHEDDWRAIAVILDEHLLRWLPEFAARIHGRCATQFYGALAVLTAVWCEELRDGIAHMLCEPRPSRAEVEERLRPKNEAPEAVPVNFIPGGGTPGW